MLRRRVLVAAVALAVSLLLTAGASWVVLARGGMSLDGEAALLVYALTETGGARLVPVVLVLALGVFATDRRVAAVRRHREWVALFVLMLLCLPATAVFVESVVKPAIAAPRPSHVLMADAGLIPDLDAFYALDKNARRELLVSRRSGGARDAATLAVHPVILDHWVHEAGSTFPSAHALNAFLAAVLFLGAAVVLATPRRLGLAVVLLAWALGVSVSRVLLRVHRPVDVVVGAVIGAFVGLVLVLVWWHVTRDKSAHLW
jgi:phosphatidylglycerophosphatase B